MILTEQNIDYISKNLELYGLKNQDLKEDILDHICTYIEGIDECDFESAYTTALNQFGGYLNINRIQAETNVQIYYKSTKNRIRFLFIVEFLTAALMITGSLFKVMHWPYAGKILVFGFALLLFVTLPFYFYSKYKDQSLKYQF